MAECSVYRLTTEQPLPSDGRTLRLNFNQRIDDDSSRVATGENWVYVVPTDGVYFIQAWVESRSLLDLGLSAFAATQEGNNLRTVVHNGNPPPQKQSVAKVDTLSFLQRGDQVWFKAGHSSGGSPPVIDGIASIALLFPVR